MASVLSAGDELEIEVTQNTEDGKVDLSQLLSGDDAVNG